MYPSCSQLGEMVEMYLSCSAGSILSGSAASMICCHELVDPGITKPNWNSHSAHAGEGHREEMRGRVFGTSAWPRSRTAHTTNGVFLK